MKNKTIDYYIEAAKEKNGFKSDNQINKVLGFKGSAVSFWRVGKSYPSDEKMIELAELAGENPHEALLHLNEWRSPALVKKAYADILQNLSRAAMLSFFGTVLVCGLYANTVSAKTIEKVSTNCADFIYYE